MRSFLCACLVFSASWGFANGNNPLKISADKVSGCSPLQVSFSAVSDSPNGLSWDFGNGYTSNDKAPLVVYTTPGIYTVKLTDGSGQPVTTTVTVHGIPQVDFKADKTKACVNDGVNFTVQPAAGSSVVNYVWGFGDGKTVTGANFAQASHIYKTSGKYDISLLVTDANGCMATKTAYALVEATTKPVADFKPSVSNSCNETENISFTNLSTGEGYKLAYTWEFGDKGVSADANPSHIFGQGKFDVTLTVKDDNGCYSTATKRVNVTKLKADFITEKDQACTGERIKFVNASNYKGTKWLWSFSDGTTSAEANPEKAFAQPGSYSVKFTVTDGICTETAAKEAFIHVRNGIKTEFTSDISQSCNQPVSVKLKNNTPNSAVVLWNFGDGTVSTKNETEKVYAAAGNYKVSLEVTDSSGCTVKKESEKVIHALKPMVNFKADTFACAGYQVKFTNFTPNAASYLWNFGDGTTSTDKNPLHIYKSNGRYTVSLTAFGDGCDSTMIMKDYVHVDTLKVDFEMAAASQTMVPPFLFSFTNKTTIPGLKFMWDFGDGYTENAVSPVHIYNTPGNFNVRLIAYSKSGCTNSKVVTNAIQMGTSMGGNE